MILSAALWTLLVVIGVPAVLASGYLMVLTLFSKRNTPPDAAPAVKFDVIVPAHNEAQGILRTIASLKLINWPSFRILVIADNCTDSTAAIARDAGVEVLERQDATLKGKGYALKVAFEHSRQAGYADALVVIDADSEVSANVLHAIAARLGSGAEAVQVDYAVLNPHAAWRTRLIAIALGSFHRLRSRARERLKLSCGVRGNGWCITHALLARVPYIAFSLTEDIEYGIDLGMTGVRVHYCDEAHIFGEMVSNAEAAGKQRQRWEQGRLDLIRKRVPPLLQRASSVPSRVCLDLALDLLVLPLSYVALNIIALLVIGLLGGLYDAQLFAGAWVGAVCLIFLALYALRGWQLSDTGVRGLLDLARVPGFIAWRVVGPLTRRRTSDWVRTPRERQ